MKNSEKYILYIVMGLASDEMWLGMFQVVSIVHCFIYNFLIKRVLNS